MDELTKKKRTKTMRTYANNIDEIISASNIELNETQTILFNIKKRINFIYWYCVATIIAQFLIALIETYKHFK